MKKIAEPTLDTVTGGIDAYVEKRKGLYKSRDEAMASKASLESEIAGLTKDLAKIQKQRNKVMNETEPRRNRKQLRQDRIDRENGTARRRLREERLNFRAKCTVPL